MMYLPHFGFVIYVRKQCCIWKEISEHSLLSFQMLINKKVIKIVVMMYIISTVKDGIGN